MIFPPPPHLFLFAAFQLASGDNHPIHYDAEYCRRRGYPGLLAHGLQVFIQTAAGAGLFPHVVDESLVAFSEASCRFLAPVAVGERMIATAQVVAEKGRKRSVEVEVAVNNRVVMTGEFTCYVLDQHVLDA